MASQSYYNQPPQDVQYANQPPQQPPPDYGKDYAPQPSYNAPDASGKNTFDQAFKLDKPKWNDLWAGILLIIVFCGFVAVSGITLNGYDTFKGFNGQGIYNNTNSFGLNTNTIVLFAFVLVVAFVLSWAYITLARTFPKAFIWVTGILNIIFTFVTAIYMLTRKYWSGGIVFLIFGIISIVFFVSWIPRIPFSALMLRTSVDVSKRHGHSYIVSLVGGLIATAFGAWYSVTLVAIYAKYEPGNSSTGLNPACASGNGGCGSGKVIGLIVFITFAMYWISEWIKNTIHTTISGIYGSWYFMGDKIPSGATRGAFRRAITYSFGSISLGSLLVALIQFARHLVSMAQQSAAQSGNIAGEIGFCVLQCFIGILEWAVEFVNRYAFSHIALYGKSYFGAAKDTWKLIKDRGIDALVNECLIGPVMSMGAMFVAFACALLAYLYVLFTSPSYNSQNAFTPTIVAFAFLIGLQIANIFTTPLNSGIDTIFVAMAWDPEVMIREHPDLYNEMIRVYPHVQTAIHA